jgi:hypothetical protein
MSVGPLGFFGSVATTPAAQRGADADRVLHDADRQHGDVQNDRQAEKAAGIGETDGDGHDTNERDADGRRPWEIDPNAKKEESATQPLDAPPLRQSKDVTGTTGVELDVTG